jgi:hypothetical protein|tara:strand:- start:97 stop:441 length:345 start_codon:yes stop_codon:yes gene_type:complete
VIWLRSCTRHASHAQVAYLFPIALTIFIAKLVGDGFTEGIYDVHVRFSSVSFHALATTYVFATQVELKQWPFLPEQPPVAREALDAKAVHLTHSCPASGETSPFTQLEELLRQQ